MRDFNVEKALKFIDEHIEEKLYLDTISEHMGYSPFYVSRMFSQEMDISIVSYVRMRKLQFAFLDLQNNKTILEVACKYGFESHEGFTRSFKRFWGFSPKVIKEQSVTYTIPNYSVMKERKLETMRRSSIEEMHRMMFLLLTESIKEMRAGYCTQIKVSILPNNYVEIMDDGRGIPLTDEKSNAMLNRIFGGHPMSSLDYASIEDFNNLELNMVNSLCESMSVCVWRNGKSFSQDYVSGVAQHELIVEPSAHQSGMQVRIKPNSNFFENILWSKEMIEQFIVQNASDLAESIGIEEVEILPREK